MSGSSDKHWKKLGEDDPYYGVVSHDQFKAGSIDDNNKEDFFKTGEEHIGIVFDTISKYLDNSFKPQSALDFGCGVGRLVVPLSKRVQRVVGVDISPGMLEEAAANCSKRGITNASFVTSDDNLSKVSGQFDLVHSFIVLQHIPVVRGRQIIDRLISLMTPGAIAVVHVTYFWNKPFYRKAINWMQKKVPGFNGVVNVAKGRQFSRPLFQMNNYDLNSLFASLHEQGVVDMHTVFTNHSGHSGVILFFKAPKK